MLLWEEIDLILKREVDELKNVLANGGAADYPGYRQLVGKIEGIEWASNNIQKMLNARLHED